MKRLIFILAALFATAQAQTIQTIGAPTTTVVSRGNFRTDSLFYLPKRSKLPTDSGAVRYQISDSSVYYWSGFQWLKLGVNIDTASMLNPYVRGSGTANYLPKFNASRSIVDSKVYETGTNLMFNTTTPYISSSGYGTFDINGSTASVLVLRKGDTARGYIGHNGATMDINNTQAGDIRFYTNAQLRGRFQTDGTFRLNSLTGTGTRSVVADANGVLSASSTPTDLIDTTYISSRAWRQKGDDSLGAIIATKGSGTVTSVATGYGLSGGTITTTGTIIVDSAIVASRLRVGKVVDSLALVKQNVLTNPVTGTGTTNYVPKFTGTSTIGNSIIYDNGTNMSVGGTSSARKISANVSPSSTGDDGVSISNGSDFFILSKTGSSYSTYGVSPDAAIIYHNNGKNISFVNDGSGGAITFNNVANNEYARFSSTGELLLRTTGDSGDYRLQINGNQFLQSASDNAFITLRTIATKSPYVEYKRGTSQNWWVGTGLNVDNNFSWYDQTSNAFRMTLTTSSELLLNTTTDAGDYKLQVSGSTYTTGDAIYGGKIIINGSVANRKLRINTASTDDDGIEINNSTNSALIIRTNASYTYGGVAGNSLLLYQPTNNLSLFSDGGVITFHTATAERARFNANGEFLINTTTDAGDYKLQVSGNAYVTGTFTAVDALQAKSALFTGNFNNSVIGWFDQNSTTTDQSFGVLIDGGTSANDYALRVRNAAASSDLFRVSGNGNVGIGTASPSASAQLDVTSTTGGFLPPRMTSTQRDAISSPAAGLVIYNTTTSKLQVYTTAWTDLH